MFDYLRALCALVSTWNIGTHVISCSYPNTCALGIKLLRKWSHGNSRVSVLFLREILDIFLGRPALSSWSVADLVTPQLCIEHFVGFHIHNLKSSQSWARLDLFPSTQFLGVLGGYPRLQLELFVEFVVKQSNPKKTTKVEVHDSALLKSIQRYLRFCWLIFPL